MEPNHTINNLTIELDKELTRYELDLMKAKILDAIDYCFNKYYPYSKVLQIEEITLDLGTIERNNFDEEYIVRLSYLLDTEIRKLFQKEGVDVLIDQQNIFNDLELFIYFLKRGVMISDSDTLSNIFQRLIKNDLQSLLFNLKKTLRDETVKERFFHQLKEDQLDEYWKSVRPLIFFEIRQFNNRIQENIWREKKFKLLKKDINNFFRRVEFEFMVNDYKSISLHDYIKFLKLYFNKSKGLVGGMNAALSQRIIKTIKENEIRESFNLSSSVKSLIDEVVIYMREERTQPIAEAKKKIIKNRFFGREIQEIVYQLVKSSFTYKKFIYVLERIYQILNSKQIELFFHILQNEKKFTFQKELIELFDIIQLTRPILSIKLHDMGLLWVIEVIKEVNNQFKIQPSLLFDFVDYISVRTGYGRDYIIDKMMKSEGSKMAKAVLKKHRVEISKFYKNDVNDSDLIDNYLYYLKSGIWDLEDQSPDGVLKILLKNSFESFITALKRERENKVVWLRLIHFHDLLSVEKVITAFFQDIKRKRKFKRIIHSVNEYDSDPLFKKHIFERLVTDFSSFDNLPYSEEGFDLDLIKEEVDSFFSQDQKIKNLSLFSIKDYIEQGKLDIDYSLIEILKMVKKLLKQDLLALSNMISFSTDKSENRLKLKRIFEIFSFAQIDILFVAFGRQESNKRKSFENFHCVKIFLHTLFSENIYHYGYQQIAGFINSFSISEPQLNSSLYALLERVALKKEMVLTALLSKIIAHLDPGEYSKLIALRRQLVHSLSNLEKAKDKNLKITDDLLLLLNYLDRGTWAAVESDPISSLKKLLEDNFDQLIIQFKKRIANQIFWLRLLYQFNFDIVLKVIKHTFKDTAEFRVLEKYLPNLDQKDQHFKFKLLEIFILVKTDLDKDEKFEELFEYQLTLSQKEETEKDSSDIENIDLDKGNIFNDFNLLLTSFFDNPTDSQADLVWLRLNSGVGNDLILNNFFSNGQYSWTLWQILFKKGVKVDLIRLLNLSLSTYIQTYWEIKLFHFFGTEGRFVVFKKSIILDFLKALFTKDRYSLKIIFSDAWESLTKKNSKKMSSWLKDNSFNEFIRLLNGYDLISKDPTSKFSAKDLIELEKNVLFILEGQVTYLIKEMRPLISIWILNIVPIATTKQELKELLILKLFSTVISYDAVNFKKLISKISSEIRLFIFTQIINTDFIGTNQIIFQQRLIYIFLKKIIEDQSLSAQFFINIDKKKLTQFLSFLPKEMRLKLMILFDENDAEEAKLLDFISEFNLEYSKSEIELSSERRDIGILQIVIDQGSLSNTPFKHWVAFEIFFIKLMSDNILKINFFQDFDSRTLNNFFALLSSTALNKTHEFFDGKKGDEVPFLDIIREFQLAHLDLNVYLPSEFTDLDLLRIVIDDGGIRNAPFKIWSSFEIFFKELLIDKLLTPSFFKDFDSRTLSQFFALLSLEVLTQIQELLDEKNDDELVLLHLIRESKLMYSNLDSNLSSEVKDLALIEAVINTGDIINTPFESWDSFETFFEDLLVRGVLNAQFFKKFQDSSLTFFYKLLSSNLLLSVESLFGTNNVIISPLYLLNDSDEGVRFQKKFLNLNALDDLGPLSSFDVHLHQSFGLLLEKVIELGFKKAGTQYKNFQEFEVEFNRQLSLQNAIWEILVQRSIEKLKVFLGSFGQETLDNLLKLMNYKFGGLLLNENIVQIKKRNQEQIIELHVSIIIFGLSHERFDQESLLQFLDEQTDSLIIPREVEFLSMDRKHDDITLSYVEAFIVSLKDGKMINEAIFPYNVEDVLNRILHFKREFFLSRLKRESNTEQVLISLFERLPEKLISRYFNQIVPVYSGQWEVVWRSMPPLVSRVIFTIKWILLGLRNYQKMDLKTIRALLTMQLTTWKKVSPPKLILSKKNKAKKSFLRAVSYNSIKDNYRAHFDIYDFVREVITTGIIPSWSSVYSVERFYEILIKLAKFDGYHFKLKVDIFLKKISNIDFLISFLGEKKFLSLYKIVRPSAHLQAKRVVDQFEQAFNSALKKSSFTNYFLLIILRYQHEYPKAKIEQIWDEILNGLSVRTQMSKMELINLTESQEAQEISAYLESTKLKAIRYANKELAWQGDIDFLLHLIIYNEYPWWSIELEAQGLSKSENLIRLTNKILNEHPKSFIEAVSILNQADDVFTKIIPIIKPQLVDRILLILSPQHGAFVINLNILIKRWGYLKVSNEWITFLFRYLSHFKSFDHGQFILSSVSFLAKKTSFAFPKINDQLLKITSDALQEGEMRFLPFMKLFNNLKTTEGAIPVPNTYFVKDDVRKNFIDIVIYYIITGSLPVDYSFLFKSYFAFIRKIESYLNTGNEDIRVAIISVMKNSEVRDRVVRNEKEDILILLMRALFPMQSELLMSYKSDIIKLFTQIWPTIQPKMINEMFYQTIYQTVLNKKFLNLTATDLVNLFLRQFQKRNQISYDLDMSAYAFLNISDKLIEMIVSLDKSKKGGKISKENDLEPGPVPIVLDSIDEIESLKLEHRIEIKNAGIVIVWPYLDRFFQMLNMTEKGAFKTEGDAVRAVHLIQYLVTGSNETPEYELLLNKILCGVNLSIPVPLQIELTDKEMETSDLMLNGVMQNWKKIKSSSIDAMREGFFMRQGFVEEKDDFWELEVEKKTIDILLKSLPWGFGMVKLPWMSKRMIVNWI